MGCVCGVCLWGVSGGCDCGVCLRGVSGGCGCGVGVEAVGMCVVWVTAAAISVGAPRILDERSLGKPEAPQLHSPVPIATAEQWMFC